MVSVVVGTIADLANVIINGAARRAAAYRGLRGLGRGVAGCGGHGVIGVERNKEYDTGRAVNGIIGIVNGMISATCSGLNAIIGMMNKLLFDIPDWVPVVGAVISG